MQTLISILSDEIGRMRSTNHSNAVTNALIFAATRKKIDAEMIARFYAPAHAGGHNGQ